MKQSKNLGFRKPCPYEDCKKPIIFEGNVNGEGYQNLICSHCHRPVKEVFEQKQVIRLAKMTIILALLLVGTTVFVQYKKQINLQITKGRE